MNTENTTTNALNLDTWEGMDRMAKNVADSKMFGVTTPAQAHCLFAICLSEGLSPIAALRRFHIIEGKPSMRADAMLADFFKAGGGAIWHVRTDQMVAATWFADAKKIDDAARARGAKRFDLLWLLPFENDAAKQSKLMQELALLAREGEETILRTYADCEQKGLTLGKGGETKTNWASSPRQMLTARCLTEGIRLVLPGLIAGIGEEGEVRDAAQSDRDARQAQLTAALGATKAATAESQQVIAERVAELKNAAMSATTTEERSRLLGEASDLANHDEIPGLEACSPVVNAEAEIVGDSAPVPEKLASAPAAAAEAPPEEPWPSDWRQYKLRKVASLAYKGKRLGTFSREEIEVLHVKRAIPHICSPDEDLKIEARYIDEALKATTPKEVAK